jgi:hypothetical protein
MEVRARSSTRVHKHPDSLYRSGCTILQSEKQLQGSTGCTEGFFRELTEWREIRPDGCPGLYGMNGKVFLPDFYNILS